MSLFAGFGHILDTTSAEISLLMLMQFFSGILLFWMILLFVPEPDLEALRKKSDDPKVKEVGFSHFDIWYYTNVCEQSECRFIWGFSHPV